MKKKKNKREITESEDRERYKKEERDIDKRREKRDNRDKLNSRERRKRRDIGTGKGCSKKGRFAGSNSGRMGKRLERRNTKT